jgi:hypothetical protein
VRPQSVVVPPPAFDHDLRLFQRIEDFAIEQFVPESGIEALDEPVLPRTAWSDVSCLRSNSGDPLLDGFGDELCAIVRPNMSGYAAQDEQVREHIEYVHGLEPPAHPDGETLMRELVDDVQHPVLSSVMGAILHKLVARDVVGPLGSQPDTGSIVEPQTPSLGLFGRHFQPLPSPDLLHSLVEVSVGSRTNRWYAYSQADYWTDFCQEQYSMLSRVTSEIVVHTQH